MIMRMALRHNDSLLRRCSSSHQQLPLYNIIYTVIFMLLCFHCTHDIYANGFYIHTTTTLTTTSFHHHQYIPSSSSSSSMLLRGWVQDTQGEWEWQENGQVSSFSTLTADDNDDPSSSTLSSATPRLPSGAFRPKQSLGQNYLKDPNTVRKILKAFAQDWNRDFASSSKTNIPSDQQQRLVTRILELGPGAGALTNPLVEQYGTQLLQCIEVDGRSVELLQERYPDLVVHHADVLQVNYAQMYHHDNDQVPLVIIGNLPYYITSQILFALADASHVGAIHSATVTMQWEVAQRMVAPTHCKDYGILSVVFQLYANVHLHFKIPPTVFYPQPKVDSALVGLHFLPPSVLAQRLAGVSPVHLRTVVTTAFQQRRKTIRNSLKKLFNNMNTTTTTREWNDEHDKDASTPPPPLPASIQRLQQQGNAFAKTQQLCQGWASKRPEELTPGQFVELTRLIYGSSDEYQQPVDENGSITTTPEIPSKVWRKVKHGV